jgi:hypothetical protein
VHDYDLIWMLSISYTQIVTAAILGWKDPASDIVSPAPLADILPALSVAAVTNLINVFNSFPII